MMNCGLMRPPYCNFEKGPGMTAVLRTPEAARYLGMAISTLTKTRVRGGPDCPPYVQLSGRAVGYLISDLDDWLAARRRASTSGTTGAALVAA
jgi:predicted DNA-binding transcriptional regulator AlpA